MVLRTARTTSRGNRILFSNDPPYSSVRVFVAGEMNEWRRYPCAECTSTKSTPASTARLAPATNAWVILWIWSTDNCLGCACVSSHRSVVGPQTLFGHPPAASSATAVPSHGATVLAFLPA